jgi:cell wall-associated NlpC family hydrolase
VVDAAYRWIGTPYRSGGTDRDGMDCSGFVTTVYQSIGRTLPRTARELFSEGRAIPLSTARPGDLVFFKNTAGRGITHVGIFTGAQEFLHSSTSKGVIVSRLDDEYYRKHYAGARRILE